MTCDNAESWLLAARSAEELPAEVRQHLAGCSECLRLFSRLRRLTEATAQLTPTPNPSARERLNEALARTPQEQPNPLPLPNRTPRWDIRLVAGLAAALLLAVGWVAGRMTSPNPVAQTPVEQPKQEPKTPQQKHLKEGPSRQVDPIPPAIPMPEPQPREPETPLVAVAPQPSLAPGLVARVARHSVSVTTDPSPASQLDALSNLASDVRADAVKRAATGDLEHLPRLLGLHERILKLGVAKQLARVPEQTRSALGVQVADGLNQSAEEISMAAGRLLPIAAELLQPLAASCREVSTAIRDNKPLPISPAWPSPATPLESLVAHTIRMADAESPLGRADESTRLAASMANAVTVLSVADLSDDAARVGESLDSVLDHGVAGNLARVEAADPTGKLRKEITDVRERAGLAADLLEGNLEKAPPAARAGLERAIAAADQGRGKATGKGPSKGTGPPWKKVDHPGKGMPPGWSKKP